MVHYANHVGKEIDQIDLAMLKLSYGPEGVRYDGSGVSTTQNENYERDFDIFQEAPEMCLNIYITFRSKPYQTSESLICFSVMPIFSPSGVSIISG